MSGSGRQHTQVSEDAIPVLREQAISVRSPVDACLFEFSVAGLTANTAANHFATLGAACRAAFLVQFGARTLNHRTPFLSAIHGVTTIRIEEFTGVSIRSQPALAMKMGSQNATASIPNGRVGRRCPCHSNSLPHDSVRQLRKQKSPERVVAPGFSFFVRQFREA